MVKRTNRKRQSKRQSRRNFRNTPSRSIINSPSSMPDQLLTKLKYGDIINGGALGTAGHAIWRGNSLFDPDQTFSGHQPLGFDQFSAFYNKYYVIGCSMKIVIANSATVPAVTLCTLRPSNTTTGGATIPGVIEKPRTVKRVIPAGGNSTVTLQMYQNTLKQFGKNKSEYMAEDLSAATITDPLLEWYWHLQYQAPDGVSQVNVQGYFEMTQFVVFFDRKRLNQS